MCGVFGYIGAGNGGKICLEGLKRLEYRGYDSAGMAGLENGNFFSWKEVGKVAALEQSWSNTPTNLPIAIAHTRWATHGKPSRENAHPHFDQRFEIAVVHNGIIENYQPLREWLQSHQVSFQSDTDTEVIAQLIAHFYKGNLVQATQEALSLLQGFWAIAVLHKHHPDTILAAARENPLAIATRPSHKESFLSSDPYAFLISGLDIFFLRRDELALIQAGTVEIFDSERTPIQHLPESFKGESFLHSKGSFEHFMLKEIFEQPDTLNHALHNRFIEELGTVEFENFTLSAQNLKAVDHILILACGSSWHAGCIGALILEEKTSIPSRAEIASEFRYKHSHLTANTLVIALSQSGETLDTLAAIRHVKQKGVTVLAISNIHNSTLNREADAFLHLRAGPEVSVCSTKAFTNQICLLSLLALLMARQRNMNQEEGRNFLSELQQLPNLAREVLTKQEEIAQLAERYQHYDNFFFLGRHYMYPTALEAALKLKEISYLNACGYPAGEMKHGPIALIDKNLPVIGLCGNQRTLVKITNNLMEVNSRGAPVIAFAFEGTPNLTSFVDEVIFLPLSSDTTAPIPFSIATQLFAYSMAKLKHSDIDQPRNLAKSVTVE